MINLFPNFKSVNQLADWIELSILYDEERISKSMIISVLSEQNQISETYENPNERTIESALNELKRRQSMLGNSSPFKIDDEDIVTKNGYSWNDIPEYVMCLIFSLQGVKKIKDDNDGTKLFERISKDAIKFYLNGEAILLGFPNTKSLNEQLLELETLSLETKSQGRSPLATDKDKGVDIIAWKPHKDGRSNQIVLLIQAAAGYHWKLKKPISETAWREFVLWSAPNLNLGIIISSTLNQKDFKKARDDYNLIFDRIRIFRALMYEGTRDPQLSSEVNEWCNNQI